MVCMYWTEPVFQLPHSVCVNHSSKCTATIKADKLIDWTCGSRSCRTHATCNTYCMKHSHQHVNLQCHRQVTDKWTQIKDTQTPQVAVVETLPGICSSALCPVGYPSPIPNDGRQGTVTDFTDKLRTTLWPHTLAFSRFKKV